jgi:hypothetical protein
MSAPDQCGCGSPVFIKKTGKCAPLPPPTQRREAGHALAQPCKRCRRRPASVASTGLCGCTTARRLARHSRVVSYDAAHARVRALRGSASSWRCVRCGEPPGVGLPRRLASRASRSCRGRAARARHGVVADPSDYDPMCRSCHGSSERADYGKGYRNGRRPRPRTRTNRKRRQYARQVAAEAGRAAYRARKRAEQPSASSVQANPDSQTEN